MDLHAEAVDVVDQLAAAGIDATIDYRDVTVPGVLVVPAAAAYDRLSDDAGTITWRLVGIAGASDPGTGLDQLGELIAACQSVADLAGVEFTTYDNPNVGHNLPAFTAQILSDWEK